MPGESARQSLKLKPVPKWQAGLLYTGAYGLGLVPFALLLLSWQAWLGLLAVTAMVFFLASRPHSGYAGGTPSVLELSFGMLARCAGGATVSMFGIGVYYFIDLFRYLFDFGEGPAWYTSLGFVGLFSLAFVFGDAADFITALYPNRPGQRSPFFPRIGESREVLGFWLRVAAIVFGAAAVVAMPYFEAPRLVVIMGLTFLLILVGASYLEAKTLDAVVGTPESAVAAVQAMLEQVGYQVIPRPRTGKDETDSAISILDFLAIRPDHMMAGRVNARSDRGDNLLRVEAASLESAVWVLQDQLQEKNADIRITPVLIALDDDGARPADAATDSPDDKSVRIVHAPSEQKLAAMVSSSDKAELKSTAERLFGLFGTAARGAT